MNMPSALDDPDKGQRLWAMLCHLGGLAGLVVPFGSVLAPLVIWLLKKEDMPFVYDQGKEAINFQITCLLGFVVSAFLVLAVIGLLLLPIVAVAWLVFTVVGAVNASDGKRYRYPLSLRLIN